jgi:hypothetical protein
MVPVAVDLEVVDAQPVADLCELVRARNPSRDLIDEQIARAVERARRSGVRWSAIAEALRG